MAPRFHDRIGAFRRKAGHIYDEDDTEWVETEKQLSPPAIYPASGSYTNAVFVSASGPECSTLHYTTDGTVPTINSPIWPDDGLSVTTTTTVMVMAAKSGCKDSFIASATYQISDIPVEMKTPLTHADISYDTSAQTYTGEALTIPVRHLGRLLREGTDYTMTCMKDGEPVAQLKDAGTYAVTFTGTGNYTGEKTVSMTVNPKAVSNPSIEVDEVTYNGSPLEPAVTVRDGDTVIPGTEYTVSYSNNMNAALSIAENAPTVTITNKDRGNYTLSSSQVFTISPMPVTVTAKAQIVAVGSDIANDPDQATLTGALEGHMLAAVTLTAATSAVTTEGAIMPGAAMIRDGETDVTANYAITYTPGMLMVTPGADDFSIDGNEYTLKSIAGWNFFCDLLAQKEKGYFTGKTVKLNGDIGTAQDPITRMAGISNHDFTGTFNGNSKTLTVNYTATEQYTAPFRYVESGCVIENLHVAGMITTSNQYAAGIVSNQLGSVTIRNCRSSVTIRSSVEGDGTHGGLVAIKGNSDSAKLTIDACVFDGKIVSTGASATTNCGGFVGWRKDKGTLTITNSIYAPTADANAVTVGATFARNWTMPDNANCYYTAALGDAQGKFIGLPTLPDGVTASAAEGDTVSYDKKIWYIGGRTVTLTVTPPEGFVLTANRLRVFWKDEDNKENDVAATQGTGDDADKWSFEMPDHDVTVTTVFIPSAFGTPDLTLPADVGTIEESAFEGDALITIVDAGNCTSIGKDAFKGCTNLTQIRLNGECDIDDTAFDHPVYVFAPASGLTKQCCDAQENLIFVENN